MGMMDYVLYCSRIQENKEEFISELEVKLRELEGIKPGYENISREVLDQLKKNRKVVLKTHFEIGDKVVGKVNKGKKKIKDLEGKVVNYYKGLYGVEWKEEIETGGSCHWKAKEGHGCYVEGGEITRILPKTQKEFDKFIKDLIEEITNGEELLFGKMAIKGYGRVKLVADEGKHKAGKRGEAKSISNYRNTCVILFDGEANKSTIPQGKLMRIQRKSEGQYTDRKFVSELIQDTVDSVLTTEDLSGYESKIKKVFRSTFPRLKEYGLADDSIKNMFKMVVNGGTAKEAIHKFLQFGVKTDKEIFLENLEARISESVLPDSSLKELADKLQSSLQDKYFLNLSSPAKRVSERAYQEYTKKVTDEISLLLERGNQGRQAGNFQEGDWVVVDNQNSNLNMRYRNERSRTFIKGSVGRIIHRTGDRWDKSYFVEFPTKECKWSQRWTADPYNKKNVAQFKKDELRRLKVSAKLRQTVSRLGGENAVSDLVREEQEAVERELGLSYNKEKTEELLCMAIPRLKQFNYSDEEIIDYLSERISHKKRIRELLAEIVPKGEKEVALENLERKLQKIGNEKFNYADATTAIINKLKANPKMVLDNYDFPWIGDAVVGIGRLSTAKYGETRIDGLEGRVVNYYYDSIGIEWKSKIKGGHKCNGNAKDGHGSYVRQNQIKPKLPGNQKEYQEFLDGLFDLIINGEKLSLDKSSLKYDRKVKLLRNSGKRKIGEYGILKSTVRKTGEWYKQTEVCDVSFDGKLETKQVPVTSLVTVLAENSQYKDMNMTVREMIEDVVSEVEATFDDKDVEARKVNLVKENISCLTDLGATREEIKGLLSKYNLGDLL